MKNKLIKLTAAVLSFLIFLNLGISYDTSLGRYSVRVGGKAEAAISVLYSEFIKTEAIQKYSGSIYISGGKLIIDRLRIYPYYFSLATPVTAALWIDRDLIPITATGVNDGGKNLYYITVSTTITLDKTWVGKKIHLITCTYRMDSNKQEDVSGSLIPSSGTITVTRDMVNEPPTMTVSNPVEGNVYSEADSKLFPTISVYDWDNNPLICRYYLDSSTTPRETKIVTGTDLSPSVAFSPINMGTLSEGSHTIRYEVIDGYADPVTATVEFKVDKSLPVLDMDRVKITSSINSVSVSGSASDSIGGLAALPYRYVVGDIKTDWISSQAYTTPGTLLPDTQYLASFEARDANGHIAKHTQNIYTKAEVPSLSIHNPLSNTVDIQADDSNSQATEYQISTGDGQQYVSQSGTLTSSPTWIAMKDRKITVSGLSPSTSYSFKAMARNGDGVKTAWSSEVSGSTTIAPPAAPRDIVATADDSSVTVSWTPVDESTGYDIEADGTVIDNGGNTSYIHDGLPAGTPHTYRVRSRNEAGSGDWSSKVLKSTLPGSPDIPVNLRAVPQSTSITVTWTNVPGATGYDIEADGVIVNNGPNTGYIHSSLEPGTHHTYRVRSINPGGKSEWSSMISASATQDTSPVPANLSAEPAQSSISLRWDSVNGATGYDIEVDGVAVDMGTSTGYTHKGLVAGSEHMYRVRSKNGGTVSDWSTAIIASALTDVFGTPASFKADAQHTSVYLSWDSVNGAEGYDVEADGLTVDNGADTIMEIQGLEPGTSHTYRVRARGDSGASDWSDLLTAETFMLPAPAQLTAYAAEAAITLSWESVEGADAYDLEMDGTVVPDVTETAYTWAGLALNSQHTLRVRAKNDNGTSAWSIPLTESTLPDTVDGPSGLTAAVRANSINVMWAPLSGVQAYDVEVDGNVTENVYGTSYSVTGLLPGSSHTCRIRARYGEAAGGWSPMLTITTLPEGPSVPTGFVASASTASVSITWDQVAGADEYEIEADGVIIENGSGTSYLHKGLIPDTAHTYRVRSKNASGTSAWSEAETVSTLSSVQQYSIDCGSGEEFSLLLTAAGIQSLGQYTFTITYNPDELEAADLCGTTPRIDLSSGNITGTDIKVTQFTPGTIVFTRTVTAQSRQSWSGTVNSIKFKALKDGSSAITYSFQ